MALEAAPWTIWEDDQVVARVDGWEDIIPITHSDYDPNEDGKDSSGNELPDDPRQDWYTYKFHDETCHRIHVKPEFIRNQHISKWPTDWVEFVSPTGRRYNLADYFVGVPRVRGIGTMLLMEASLRLKIARCDRYQNELQLCRFEEELVKTKRKFEQSIRDFRNVCGEERYTVEDIVMAGSESGLWDEHEIVTPRHMEAFSEVIRTHTMHQEFLRNHAELEIQLRQVERQYELLKDLAREATMPMRRARRGPTHLRWRILFRGTRRELRQQRRIWNEYLVEGEQLMPGEIHLRLNVANNWIEHS